MKSRHFSVKDTISCIVSARGISRTRIVYKSGLINHMGNYSMWMEKYGPHKVRKVVEVTQIHMYRIDHVVRIGHLGHQSNVYRKK